QTDDRAHPDVAIEVAHLGGAPGLFEPVIRAGRPPQLAEVERDRRADVVVKTRIECLDAAGGRVVRPDEPDAPIFDTEMNCGRDLDGAAERRMKYVLGRPLVAREGLLEPDIRHQAQSAEALL